MKKAGKILLSVIGVLVVLIIIAVVVAALNLDRIVKKSVEKYGPQITKVTVTLDAVHIGLFSGSAGIKGLAIGNPPGCQAPQSISVGEASVSLKPSSILSSKIIVHSVKVESPHIDFEGALNQNNLTTIKDNVSGTAEKGGPPATTPQGQPKPEKKYEVDDFLITGAKVSGTLKVLNREVPIPNITLREIHLTNLGTGPEGITATELSKRVMEEVNAAVIQELSKYATDVGKGALNLGSTNLNGIKKTIGNLLNKK